MSEESTSPAKAGDAGPVAGERLAEARRARDVSLDEIARELHLDNAKVQALEQNDFGRLGAPVFVKGYLRKYASLVGVSGDAVLDDYERLHPSAAAPPIVGLRPQAKPPVSPGPWIATVAIVGFAALGAWWWFADGPGMPGRAALQPADPVPAERRGAGPAEDRPAPGGAGENRPPTGTPGAQAPAGEPEVGETGPPEAPAANRQADSPAAAVAAGEQRAAVPVPAPEEEQQAGDPVPAAGQVAMQLIFSGDCWTEVTDADGDRLYFGLGTDGRTVSVRGEPPLQVLLGDSENARVTVEGRPYAIPPSARRGDTARFTIAP